MLFYSSVLHNLFVHFMSEPLTTRHESNVYDVLMETSRYFPCSRPTPTPCEMQHAPAPPPPLSASAHLCPSSRSASTGEHGSLSELSGTMGHARRGKWRTEPRGGWTESRGCVRTGTSVWRSPRRRCRRHDRVQLDADREQSCALA